MTGEFELIEKLTREWRLAEDVRIGPGDDTSAVEIVSPRNELLLQTTDLLIENVHFQKEWSTPFELGWKSLAVNLSDIAAMGGTPRHTHLSLAVPTSWTEAEILSLMQGYKTLADRFPVSLIGGDLSKSPNSLIISAVVDGFVPTDQVIRRKGSLPGDVIWVSGTLGDASAGLQVFKNRKQDKFKTETLQAFVKPEPEIELGKICAESGLVNAMIDLSDGLTGDLGHILKASGVGAVINEDQLPVSGFTKRVAAEFNLNPLEFALRGGEDYHLLGCTPEGFFNDFAERVKDKLGKSIYALGRITGEPGLRFQLKSGDIKEISPTAHDHFASK